MRYKQNNERRAVILMVVLSLLTLFAIVGISFVLYADAEAASARVARQAETQQRPDVPPEQALAYFLSQLIYDVNDTTGVGSGLRGHSLARTMYGYNYPNPPATTPIPNVNPFNGIGRLHYQNPAVGQDDYISINYTWFGGAVRDPERYGSRATPTTAQTNPYFGGNAPYTYPDLNNFYLAAVTANGTVLTPSFHRKWLFNPNNNFNDLSNPNWTNAQGKYLTLRPRPADHGNLFPAPDDAFGDVKNLVWAPGGNDSIWIDIGAPVMTAPDGTLYKMLVAPLIMDLDGRINLGSAGNILAYQTATPSSAAHVSNMGLGGWEVNLGKILYADNAANPTEWINLFQGKLMPGGNTVYGKYGMNGTPSSIASATSGTLGHTYAQDDVNGLNESVSPFGSASLRSPAPPGFPGGIATYAFPMFLQGYYNGGVVPSAPAQGTLEVAAGTTELTNHPLLYNMFRPPWYNGSDDRIFHASDMESLLRPNNNFTSLTIPPYINPQPPDSGSPALLSDLIRLCPYNFGPSAAGPNNTYPRYRNFVTTLSTDLGVPGVSPYWWFGMPATSILAPNPNPQLPPFGQAVPFPSLPPNTALAPAGTTNTPTISLPAIPPTSEFSTNWRSLAANTISYFSSTNPAGYTTPGARIRLNRPLPPYPHMGAGVTPPYILQAPNTESPYGTAYNLGNTVVANQYQAALNARQALANDIYRRLLALAGIAAPANTAAPSSTDLSPRRWLAQLAVNMVDFIDEDDISTPFNFYTIADGLAAASLGATTGGDDNSVIVTNTPTGANPVYWVFGTELPKVVLNEVLAEAQDPLVPLLAPPAFVTITESVKVWVELFNTMPAAGGTNTQPQDLYRVPLWVLNPAAGAGAGYSPYRITVAQNLMQQVPTGTAAPAAGATDYLPDPSANVLGKAYIAAPPLSPLPISTTDADFSPATSPNGVPLSQDLNTTTPPAPLVYQTPSTPAAASIVNAGVDNPSLPTGPYFLIGPKTYPANPNPKNTTTPYQNPFVSPGLPNNVPVLQTDSLSYFPNWPITPGSTSDERTTGLTVLLRRLANPYLPLQTNPALPYYNPYVTVDSISNVPIQNNYGLIQNPQVAPLTSISRGKTQPYAALTQLTVPNTAMQFPAPGSAVPTPLVAGSPVFNQAGPLVNNVISTFGLINSPMPPSGHYDWLVHLDRPPISPMELLHVSAWPPYMLTQRFMLGSDNLLTPPTPANALNMFGHYAPWLDAPPGGAATLANMSCPWWSDATLTPGQQSHRLYRLLEFFESGDWATGVNGLGRIPGKVNINTIWDQEILQALIDANSSMGITPPIQYPPPPSLADPIQQVFNNLMQSRSPNALYSYNAATGAYACSGTIGAVNMGTGNDDRPFLPLSAGLSTAGAGTQYPNGVSVTTDTMLRTNNPFANGNANPVANQWLLFQNPTDGTTNPLSGHPYLQTQLLTKLYNKVTTRSNTFAVFLTTGFFQVTNATTTPPTLGAEVGRSEGRQIRHRMFAIVDRTNLSAFTTSSSSSVTGPTIATQTNPMTAPNFTGQSTITLNSGLPTNFQIGMQLVIEPGTANEETVMVQTINPMNPLIITANFTKAHPNSAVTGNPSTTYQIIQRGNPGPPPSPYNPRNDPLVVPYFSIID